MRDFTGLLKLAYITFDRVRDRPVDVHPFGIWSGGSKTANRSDTPYPNRGRISGNILALSSVAVPVLTYMLFRKRGKNILRQAERLQHLPTAKKISREKMLEAAFGESLNWSNAGYKLNPPSIVQAFNSSITGPSSFSFDPVKREGKIRIGVNNISDARRNGVNADVFWHELGHAHDAFKTHPRTVGEAISRKIKGLLYPLKRNPVYNEELRAWNNALKFTNGGIDKDVMDSALATYRNSIHGSQATIGAGLASAGIIGSRFFGNENKQ